jgi:hypothetical protein
MAGGLFNLISRGTNNVIIHGNPGDNVKSLFRVVYSKITNFGLQKFRIDFDGLRDLRLTEPSKFTFKIPRYAELLMDTYLVLNLPNIYSPIYHPCTETGNVWSPYDFKWIDDLGTNIISEITITCGSQLIQKYSGAYLAAMVNRDFNSEKKKLFASMTGNTYELNDPANAFGRKNVYPSAFYTSNVTGAEPSIRSRQLFIPINTWFTLDSRCAFPLVALQYNEMYINITLRPIQELFRIRDVFDPTNNYPYVQPDFNSSQFQMYRYLQTPPNVNLSMTNYSDKTSIWNADIHLISTYCFLDDDERRVFARDSQVYLIKDVYEYNFQNISGSAKLKLTSNGMISSWMWFLQRNDANLRNEWSNYTNWPYKNLPGNIVYAPETNPLVSGYGPAINPDGTPTGLFITGNFNPENRKEILETMGILFNGDYKENVMVRGIYDYVEKYTRTQGNAQDGLYCYNFCLNTSPFEYQPTGAINMTKFKDIQLEVTTFIPTIDPTNSNYQILCDGNGNILGINKQNWRLYEYTYNMTLFEERYNILSFIGGNCGMMYAK